MVLDFDPIQLFERSRSLASRSDARKLVWGQFLSIENNYSCIFGARRTRYSSELIGREMAAIEAQTATR
jgi:hypothetical protein